MSQIRASAVAGTFYPADPAALSATVSALLALPSSIPSTETTAPKALIVPHAGYVYSGPVAASAYRLLAPLRDQIKRVVLLGPSHRIAFRGMAATQAQIYRTPLGDIPLDQDWLAKAAGIPGFGFLDQAHDGEHSLEVHLPFLQTLLGAFKLVPIVCGQAEPGQVAALLACLWGGPETLVVISSDLSHYLDYENCRALDNRTCEAIEHLDAAALGQDQACGRVPVGGLLALAQQNHLRVATLDLRNSGDTAGPRDRVVGYGAWAFWETEGGPIAWKEPEGKEAEGDGAEQALHNGRALAARHGAVMLGIAWDSIRLGLAHGKPPYVDLNNAPAELRQPGACFVTLQRGGALLRGCIGSAQAWRPLAEDLADNAFKAAFGDSRFPPLQAAELEGLTLSLSLLTPPQPMSFRDQADLLAQLVVRRDGLIIEDGPRRALFLPSVWESLPVKGDFLAHLKAKAGLSPGHWSPSFKASRFFAVEIGKD